MSFPELSPDASLSATFRELFEPGEALAEDLQIRLKLAYGVKTRRRDVPDTHLKLRRSNHASLPGEVGELITRNISVVHKNMGSHLLDVVTYKRDPAGNSEVPRSTTAFTIRGVPHAEVGISRGGRAAAFVGFKVLAHSLPNLGAHWSAAHLPDSTRIGDLEPINAERLRIAREGILLNVAAIERLAEGQDTATVVEELREQQTALYEPVPVE